MCNKLISIEAEWKTGILQEALPSEPKSPKALWV